MAQDIDQAAPDEARLRPAIGPRADYYLRHWAAMRAGGKAYDWNWAACLLSVFWFAYRKMWGWMAVVALPFLVASPFLDPTHKTAFRIAAFGLVGVSFVTGGLGNAAYRRRIERLVAGSETPEQLRESGGVSLGAAIGALVGVTVLSALAGMVPALMARGG